MTNISGQGVTAYRRQMSSRRGLPGSIANLPFPLTTPGVNPKKNQVSRNAIGGTAADGTYTTVITEPDGTVHTASVVRSTTPATNADIAAAMRTAINNLASLAGIASAAGSSANVDITFEHEGLEYTVTGTAPGTGTSTITTVTAAGGTTIPFGRFVVHGAALTDNQYSFALPSGSTVAADIRGISLRDLTMPNQGSVLDSGVDAVPAGACFDVAWNGTIYMLNCGGAVTKGTAVHVVINTAGGDELGQARGDTDSGNAIALAAGVARWTEDVAAGAIGPVLVQF